MYLLGQIPRRCGDISPHFPSVLIPRPNVRHIKCFFFAILPFICWRYSERKDQTKDSTQNGQQCIWNAQVMMKRNFFIGDHCHHYRTVKSTVQSKYNSLKKILTGCNEGEENNFGPDIVYNGGLELFEGDPNQPRGLIKRIRVRVQVRHLLVAKKKQSRNVGQCWWYV